MSQKSCLLLVTLAAALSLCAGEKSLGYQDTPMQPDGKWHVHDGNRPQPTVVTPGTASTEEKPGTPPADAIVLFDGKDLSKWRAGNGKDSGWKVENGAMVVPPKGTENGGDIWTKDEFGDCQLHIEWATPATPKGDGQGRGNSGVFFFGKYELQVLDSYNNPTYPDGQASSVYAEKPPLVNASSKPGEWQTYDILWTAPRFKDGKVESPAYITVIHNGVVTHNHLALQGINNHKSLSKYVPHGEKGPIKLQDHGDPMRFRNIWIRPIKGYDEK